MIGGQDCPNQMNLWPLEDNIVGRFDVKNVELCDNIVWIRSDGERDCSRQACLCQEDSTSRM